MVQEEGKELAEGKVMRGREGQPPSQEQAGTKSTKKGYLSAQQGRRRTAHGLHGALPKSLAPESQSRTKPGWPCSQHNLCPLMQERKRWGIQTSLRTRTSRLSSDQWGRAQAQTLPREIGRNIKGDGNAVHRGTQGFPGAQMVKNPPAMRETWV